ncbi:MAG: head-tail adaptor protein [Allosphingosinicella sp.]
MSGAASGSRDRRIRLERPTEGETPLGADLGGFEEAGETFARVTWGRAGERRQAAQDGASLVATFTVLRTALTAAVAPSWRIVFDGGTWDIGDAVPIGRGDIEITATRRLAGGPA